MNYAALLDPNSNTAECVGCHFTWRYDDKLKNHDCPRCAEKGLDPLQGQEGGDHYKRQRIQPVEYIHANGIPFIEGCIIKYASRHRDKGKAEDIRKIIHYCELLLKLEYNE